MPPTLSNYPLEHPPSPTVHQGRLGIPRPHYKVRAGTTDIDGIGLIFLSEGTRAPMHINEHNEYIPVVPSIAKQGWVKTVYTVGNRALPVNGEIVETGGKVKTEEEQVWDMFAGEADAWGEELSTTASATTSEGCGAQISAGETDVDEACYGYNGEVTCDERRVW